MSSSSTTSASNMSQHVGDGTVPAAADAIATTDAHPGRRKRKRKNRKAKRHTHRDGAEETQRHAASEAGRTRRFSITKAARDPCDEYVAAKKASRATEADTASKGNVSPVIDFDGLSRPSAGTRARLEESPEKGCERMDKLRGAVRTILECVGEDPGREGLLATPERFAKAVLFFTKGYQENVGDIVNNAIFHEGHNEMVIVKDIHFSSLCEHHLVPFVGKVHVGYIPHDSVIGISKLPRIVDLFSRRLQIQERLTREIATALMEILKPQGVAVVMESSHFCMVMRGVEKTQSSTITSCVLGCFEKKSKTRNEFMNLINLNRS